MTSCIITSVEHTINIFLDDVVPYIEVSVVNDHGKLILSRKKRDTNYLDIFNAIDKDGYYTIKVEANRHRWQKRIYYKT